jgi:hypothetical protein
MASTINASTTGLGSVIITPDSTGALELQTNSTTAVTIDTSQRAVFVAGTAALPAITTTGDTNTGIFFPAADTIAFSEGGTESVRIDSSGVVTGTAGNLMLISSTAQATTSGTSKDFTGIPSWVKRITVMLQSVSTNGTSVLQIQIGSGSIANTGYESGVWSANTSNLNNTTGFAIAGVVVAGSYSGICTLTLLNSATNLWVQSGAIGQSVVPTSNGAAMVSGGNKTLSGVLDRVRITTVSGTDAFDAGSVNILYE